MITDKQTEGFLNLFAGLKSAHGRFHPAEINETNGKLEGRSETVREEATLLIWKNHLEGVLGLGIVPICHDNKCVWGVIDIDTYPIDFIELLTKVQKGGYPLICCQSKSGGAHLFLFLKEPTDAGKVQKYLRSVSSSLGLSGCEIFPKQAKILADRGDVGNWLNMPYFGNTRLGITLEKQLTLDEFLELANKSKHLLSDTATNGKLDLSKSTLVEAPPCLQTMELSGFPPHSRNQALFGMGVYAKKVFPANWKRVVENYNRTFFPDNPLTSGEVEAVNRSLDKKEYFYRCNEEPMVSFCNTTVCRTRKFGIGNGASMPIINSVTKLLGDVVIWFIDVEGGRLELTTEELYDIRLFQRKCMDALNLLPHKMNVVQWTAFLQKLIDTAVIVKPEEASGYKDQLWDLFTQYSKNRITENPSEIEDHRTYYSKTTQEIWFKLKDFYNFLGRKQFKMPKTLIIQYLRENGLRRSSRQYNNKLYMYYAVHVDEIDVGFFEITKKEDKDNIL